MVRDTESGLLFSSLGDPSGDEADTKATPSWQRRRDAIATGKINEPSRGLCTFRRCNALTIQRFNAAKQYDATPFFHAIFFMARKHCDANFVNILALGLHSGGASRF